MDVQAEPLAGLVIKSVMMEWSMAEGELTGHGVVTFEDGYTLLFITAYNPTAKQIQSAIKRCRLVAAGAYRDGTTSAMPRLTMEW